LRVTLGYETGPEKGATLTALDLSLSDAATGPRIAVITRDTHPQFGKAAKIYSQKIPADPQRTLRSITFSFDSLTPLQGVPEIAAKYRFTVGIFAVSALPAASTPPRP
jgi:hypothetical protein